MNTINIIVQGKDDPKNLLDTKEKADKFKDGLTVVFIEAGTQDGQIGIELIIKGVDIYGNKTIIGAGITENNFDGLMGAFIGSRMRFGRMPRDQWELVRHYLKDQINRYVDTLPGEEKAFGEKLKKHFRT